MAKTCGAQTKVGLPCRNDPGRYKHCVPHRRTKFKPTKRPKVNYKRYMSSAAWRAKRAEYINSPETSNDCYGCGMKNRTGFHLHHVTYVRLGYEKLSDLVMVCVPCHEAIHEANKYIKPLTLATDAVRAAHGLHVNQRPGSRRKPKLGARLQG